MNTELELLFKDEEWDDDDDELDEDEELDDDEEEKTIN